LRIARVDVKKGPDNLFACDLLGFAMQGPESYQARD
jgi:hypothetical protein